MFIIQIKRTKYFIMPSDQKTYSNKDESDKKNDKKIVQEPSKDQNVKQYENNIRLKEGIQLFASIGNASDMRDDEFQSFVSIKNPMKDYEKAMQRFRRPIELLEKWREKEKELQFFLQGFFAVQNDQSRQYQMVINQEGQYSSSKMRIPIKPSSRTLCSSLKKQIRDRSHHFMPEDLDENIKCIQRYERNQNIAFPEEIQDELNSQQVDLIKETNFQNIKTRINEFSLKNQITHFLKKKVQSQDNENISDLSSVIKSSEGSEKKILKNFTIDGSNIAPKVILNIIMKQKHKSKQQKKLSFFSKEQNDQRTQIKSEATLQLLYKCRYGRITNEDVNFDVKLSNQQIQSIARIEVDLENQENQKMLNNTKGQEKKQKLRPKIQQQTQRKNMRKKNSSMLLEDYTEKKQHQLGIKMKKKRTGIQKNKRISYYLKNYLKNCGDKKFSVKDLTTMLDQRYSDQLQLEDDEDDQNSFHNLKRRLYDGVNILVTTSIIDRTANGIMTVNREFQKSQHKKDGQKQAALKIQKAIAEKRKKVEDLRQKVEYLRNTASLIKKISERNKRLQKFDIISQSQKFRLPLAILSYNGDFFIEQEESLMRIKGHGNFTSEYFQNNIKALQKGLNTDHQVEHDNHLEHIDKCIS